MTTRSKLYVYLVSTLGLLVTAGAMWYATWPHDSLRLAVYLVLSLVAAGLKLRLPGLTGTMSLGFVFVLLGILQLALGETLFMACIGVVLQCLWRPRQRPQAIQVIFSVAAVAISAVLTYACTELVRQRWHTDSLSVLTAFATCLYFVANSLLVSGALARSSGRPMRAVWEQCYLISFPYYLAGGVVAGLVAMAGREVGWKLALLILPVTVLTFWLFRIYLRLTVVSGQASGKNLVVAQD